MSFDKRAVLQRDHPERYATTGLDWGNSEHYEAIANGLFQTLMGLLARRQGMLAHAEGEVLRRQQARIEQRLSVVERALFRRSGHVPRRMEDAVVVHGLEKMADAFEDGAAAWLLSKAEKGSNVLAGTMLGVGVGFAATVRGHGMIERFTVGPFGGLSKIGAMVTRPDVLVELEDLPELDALVRKAREIPTGHVVTASCQSSASFCESIDAVLVRLQTRDQERDWTA
ncbi:hypothetical protein [Hyphomicrobium sp. DMF-1]|uniref:hypothetical protein n=1 Tax=Hyphomicrobium sp. DMF-1 TaxID=3019544 RepID=UPI0022EBA943|nr:hypothetical protein [Hyphomicrobium sp. DMF-1]WBT37765.1 hypothetical protein PE058_19215 [Hyphomicrobium sp. DMF-1]